MSSAAPAPILFFDHTAAWSGGEVALFHLVTHLDSSRFRPIVVLGEEGPLAVRLRDAGVEVHVLPLAGSVGHTRKASLGVRGLLRCGVLFGSLRYVWRLRKLIRSLRPAVVFTNSLKADLLGGLAARLARVQLIWSVQDRIAEDYLPKAMVRVFRCLVRWLPHTILANSRATLETLRLPAKWHGVRAHVVHCGVCFPKQAAERPPGSELCVGIVGRLAPWKGQDIFLRAAARLAASFPSVRFQIIGAALFGESDFGAGLERLAAELGISRRVDFLGFRQDIPAVLRGLDIVVHASTTPEPFGLVIAEAMAAGRAVIATKGGGVPEIVDDGRTGLLVPMGDVAALSDAMSVMLRDGDLRARLALAGREHVRAQLTVERQARQVMAILAPFRPPNRPAVPALAPARPATEL